MASSQEVNLRGGDTDLQTEGTEGTEYHAVYPPVVESVEDMGYVRDINKRGFWRDMGRSAIIGGRYYYIYGDTYCKDANGEHCGAQSSSYAITSKDKPLKNDYLGFHPDGKVEPLIPLDREEVDIQATKLPLGEIFRVKLWCFGGIVETSPGVGWLWFQKSVYRGDDEVKYYGVCVARVSVDKSSGRLNVVRITGNILQNPGADDMIFFEDEPRIGAFSTLVEGSFIYLWGTYNKDVVLARVPLNSPHVRSEYRYWNGVEYVEDIKHVEPLIHGMQQGAIVKSDLFGKDKPWVVVGCTYWKDSRVMMGAAENLEGPWQLTHIFDAFGKDAGGNRYCIYPHPWIFEAEKGQMAISWSEHWPGNVIMTKFNFAMRSRYWCQVPLDSHSRFIQQWILHNIRQDSSVREHKVNVSTRGFQVFPGMVGGEGYSPLRLHIEGDDKIEVDTIKAIVENRLIVKSGEEAASADVEKEERKRKRSFNEVLERIFRSR